MFANYLVAGANTFHVVILLILAKDEVKLWVPALAALTPHIQAPHSRSPPVTQCKHRQLPIHGEMHNPSSFHDPGAISKVQRDTCTLVTGKSGSGLVMREGVCSLLDPSGNNTEILKV